MSSLSEEIQKLKDKAANDETENTEEYDENDENTSGYDHGVSRPKLSEAFIDNIREWLNIVNQRTELNLELKELNKRKLEKENIIKESMKKYSLGSLEIPGAQVSISIEVSKVAKPLKKEDILNSLVELFGDDKAHKVFEHIYSKRVYVESERLGKKKI